MVTAAQIQRLDCRIDELARMLVPERRPEYVVYISYIGELDDEFFARYPGARQHRGAMIELSFGDHGHDRPN